MVGRNTPSGYSIAHAAAARDSVSSYHARTSGSVGAVNFSNGSGLPKWSFQREAQSGILSSSAGTMFKHRPMEERSRGQLPDLGALVLLALSFFVVIAFLGYFVFIARTPSLRKHVAGDFPEWVIGARLLRDAPDRLYDIASQEDRYAIFQNSLGAAGSPSSAAGIKTGTAGKEEHYLYLYPPFVAAFFTPIVAAPFPVSFLVWACFSTILYLTAIVLLAPSHDRFMPVWLALASPLFLWYTIVYGQLSAIACAAVAGAVFFERRGHNLLSGLALGLCAYKPTLLIWIVPMLLLSGRFRALLGMACTGSVLAAVSIAVAGWRASLDWLHLLFRWGNRVTIAGGKYPRVKFVDLNACINLFGSQAKWIALPLAGIVAAACIIIAVQAWKGSIESRWAATLTLAVLVNVYTPMYDAVILVLAMLVLWRQENARACAMFMVALHLAAWWSEDLSKYGWPLVTMVAFGFMIYQGWRSTEGVRMGSHPNLAAPSEGRQFATES
jgi:Glycosyltransferase family 87